MYLLYSQVMGVDQNAAQHHMQPGVCLLQELHTCVLLGTEYIGTYVQSIMSSITTNATVHIGHKKAVKGT